MYYRNAAKRKAFKIIYKIIYKLRSKCVPSKGKACTQKWLLWRIGFDWVRIITEMIRAINKTAWVTTERGVSVWWVTVEIKLRRNAVYMLPKYL